MTPILGFDSLMAMVCEVQPCLRMVHIAWGGLKYNSIHLHGQVLQDASRGPVPVATVKCIQAESSSLERTPGCTMQTISMRVRADMLLNLWQEVGPYTTKGQLCRNIEFPAGSWNAYTKGPQGSRPQVALKSCQLL